jgi:hypothetical protein
VGTENGILTLLKIIYNVHLIDIFRANMLIGTDILKLYRIVINFESVLFRVDLCSFEVLIKTEYKGIRVYRKVKVF